jgi:hypothetical protein
MRTLRIALLSALLLVGSAAPAFADEYAWSSCPDSAGEFVGLTPVGEPESGIYDIAYTLVPCATPSTEALYGVAVYHADGTADALLFFYPPEPATLILEGQPIQTDDVAICLLTRLDYRISCAQIDAESSGFPELGSTLPADAPSVSVLVTATVAEPHTQPICPTCMT